MARRRSLAVSLGAICSVGLTCSSATAQGGPSNEAVSGTNVEAHIGSRSRAKIGDPAYPITRVPSSRSGIGTVIPGPVGRLSSDITDGGTPVARAIGPQHEMI